MICSHPPNAPPSSPLAKGVLLAILLLLGSLTDTAARDEEDDTEEGSKRPKLNLSITPAHGFVPLTVSLDATLTGVSPQDQNFCHPSVTWTRIDPSAGADVGTTFTEDPACIHDEDALEVRTTFSKTFYLHRPGTFLYRISIEGKDGKSIQSSYVKVRVLSVP